MVDLVGRSFGPYHILEPLGEGGMAAVYLALDNRLERKVAIKVILPGHQQNEKFLKRFEYEARALAQLTHPNIVGIIDYGQYEGLPYLVMEYLPGGNLKQLLAEKRLSPGLSARTGWQEAARLLAPIARSLDYAHKHKVHKIIHRDVKPSNILLTESGQPMLSDFGIAKILDAEETADLTASGTGVGTPEYMAPEQAMGKMVDARADIYALGVVYYEMVTGRKPFQADTPMAVMLKKMTEPLPRPRQFIPDLPDQVEATLIKALNRDPDQRYASMADFATRLEELGNGQVGEDKPPQPPKKRMPPWSWWLIGIGGLTACLVVVFLSWGLWQYVGTKDPEQPAREATESPLMATSIPLADTAMNTPLPPTLEKTSTVAGLEIPFCPGPLPSRLLVGMSAEVTTSGKAWQLTLRSEPGFGASMLHIIAAGRGMVILEGPECKDGSYWWYIRSEQGYVGWAPEGDFEDYWIDPLP